MKTEVSLSKLYFDPKFSKYFFRNQSYRTFEDLVEAVNGDKEEASFNELVGAIENSYDTLDDFEADCYDLSVDEILENLGYEWR